MRYTKDLMRSIAGMAIDARVREGRDASGEAEASNDVKIEVCFGMAVLLPKEGCNEAEFNALLDRHFSWVDTVQGWREMILDACHWFKDLA